MPRLLLGSLALLSLSSVSLVSAQQQCYYGPGAEFRGPSNLVPCLDSGESACCLLGDTCLSGNTCYNYATGDLYQYGCTDATYTDPSCPYKCGWNATLSPWTALEYCTGVKDIKDTWVCHTPESCGCEWNATYSLLELAPRGCQDMGYDARVALYAPSALAPYVSLPSTFGGKTLYYSGTTISGTSTWISTALKGYTPSSIGPLTTYATPAPTKVVQLFPNQQPAPATLPAAVTLSATVTPEPDGTWTGSQVHGLSSSTSSSSSSSSTSSTSKTTTKPIVHTVTATNSASTGLSTGAQAGIGVGVAVLVLVAAALIGVLYYLRRLKAKRAAKAAAEEQSHTFSEKSPGWQAQGYPNAPPGSPPTPMGFYDGHGYHGEPAMVHEAGGEEVDRQRVAQMKAPMEMDGRSGPVELGSREEVRGELETPSSVAPSPSPKPGSGVSRFREGP